MSIYSNSLRTVATLRRDLLRKMRQVGPLGTLRHGAAKVFRELRYTASVAANEDAFDLKYGTDTAGILSVGALDIPDNRLEQAIRYEPVQTEVFCRILQELSIPHERFVFVDVGSGKGRVLLLASRFSFKEIIGVELSRALSKVAVRNIQLFKDDLQKCFKIRVECHDAVSYELPPEDTVLFLYNPFHEKLMREMVSSVESSIRRHRRKMYVLYNQPLHRSVWDNSNLFQVAKSTEGFVIYETKPS